MKIHSIQLFVTIDKLIGLSSITQWPENVWLTFHAIRYRAMCVVNNIIDSFPTSALSADVNEVWKILFNLLGKAITDPVASAIVIAEGESMEGSGGSGEEESGSGRDKLRECTCRSRGGTSNGRSP